MQSSNQQERTAAYNFNLLIQQANFRQASKLRDTKTVFSYKFVTICISDQPKHLADFFNEQSKELSRILSMNICFKDKFQTQDVKCGSFLMRSLNGVKNTVLFCFLSAA